MSSQYMTPAGELSCHEGEHETIKKMSKNSLEYRFPSYETVKNWSIWNKRIEITGSVT